MIADRGDLRERRAVGIVRSRWRGALEREDRVEPRRLADRPPPSRARGARSAPSRAGARRRAPRTSSAAASRASFCGVERATSRPRGRSRRSRGAGARARGSRAASRRASRTCATSRGGTSGELLAQLAQQLLGLGRASAAPSSIFDGATSPSPNAGWRSHSAGVAVPRIATRLIAHAGGEVLQEVDRVGAAQLEVLDDEHDRAALGLGGEQALERHEQARLEPLRRLEQRRRRPGCRRTARAAGARSGARPRRRAAAGTTSATPAWILSRLSAGSSPGTRPKRAVSARAIGPYACAFSSATPVQHEHVRVRRPRARDRARRPCRLLPMPGSPITTANASAPPRRTPCRSAPGAARSRALRPVNRGRRSYGRGRDDRRSPRPRRSSPSSIGSNDRRRLGPARSARRACRRGGVCDPRSAAHGSPLSAVAAPVSSR